MNNRPAKINTATATKTLRDEFAMAALTGMLASCDTESTWAIPDAANRAYQ